MKTELYYIHGFRSHPDQSNPKTEFLKLFCEDCDYDFVAPNMEWETRGCDILEQLVDSFRFIDRQDSILRQNRRRIFVGTSLGGAAALRLFRDFSHNEARCFIINPVLDYNESSFYELEQVFHISPEVPKLMGLFNFYTGQDSAMTQQHLTDIRQMIVSNQLALDKNEPTGRLSNLRMFIGMNDDILNPEIAEWYARRYDILTSFSQGTHSFSDEDSMTILKYHLNNLDSQ